MRSLESKWKYNIHTVVMENTTSASLLVYQAKQHILSSCKCHTQLEFFPYNILSVGTIIWEFEWMYLSETIMLKHPSLQHIHLVCRGFKKVIILNKKELLKKWNKLSWVYLHMLTCPSCFVGSIMYSQGSKSNKQDREYQILLSPGSCLSALIPNP